MNLMKTALLAFLALSFAAATRASASEANATPPAPHVDTRLKTGLHANDVGPIVAGVAAESAQVFVYAGCVLALDDHETCIEIASKARDAVAQLR
jgi:hypothetical protein